MANSMVITQFIKDLENMDLIMVLIVLDVENNRDEKAYSKRLTAEGDYRIELQSKINLYLSEIENKLLKLYNDQSSKILLENIIRKFEMLCSYV